jgi:hypothetical protein
MGTIGPLGVRYEDVYNAPTMQVSPAVIHIHDISIMC